MDQREIEAVFAFICQYIREHSHPPTLREIGVQFYMSSTRAMRCLDQLEAKGWIIREPNRKRGITLLRACPEQPVSLRSDT